MTLEIALEKVNIKGKEYPVPQDGLSQGSISVRNVTALVELNRNILEADIYYDTITLTLKGIPYPAPLVPRGYKTFGTDSFEFRGRNYRVTNLVEGTKLKVGNSEVYLTWTITGIDTANIRMSVG